MTDEEIRLILGRDERPLPLPSFKGKLVLVTGAAGSIGRELVPKLVDAGASVASADIEDLDVRDGLKVRAMIKGTRSDIVFHLAAMKYAPEGEINPADTVDTNINGTRNVLSSGIKTVTVSTCKAIEPETVYGATKLIAERMTLNHGGVVARLYNVVPAIGNVFETWAGTKDPVPVTPCSRYFISVNETVSLLLNVALQPSGRYTINPGLSRSMTVIAMNLGRTWRPVLPRRGDRRVEPLVGVHETLIRLPNGLIRIDNAHDEERMAEAA